MRENWKTKEEEDLQEEAEEEAAMRPINVGSSCVLYPSSTSGYDVITVGLNRKKTHTSLD